MVGRKHKRRTSSGNVGQLYMLADEVHMREVDKLLAQDKFHEEWGTCRESTPHAQDLENAFGTGI
jgi:hypothetical protein